MSTVRFGGLRRIAWLASWPKSGNTWVRCLLSNFILASSEPVSINKLLGEPAASRQFFDRAVGVSQSHCTDDEIEPLLPSIYRYVAAARVESGQNELLFFKTHDVFRNTESGEPLFPGDVTAGAVYVLRNPLDVAVSYHSHFGTCCLPAAIAALDNPSSFSGGSGTRFLRQRQGDWSSHVESWTRAPFPVLVLRYEDLLADTVGVLARLVRFLKLDGTDDATKLQRAVEFSSFARLQEAESQHGFRERSPVAQRFFRSGRVGDWRRHLTATQAWAVLEAHGPVMSAWGYDCEALLREIRAKRPDTRPGALSREACQGSP